MIDDWVVTSDKSEIKRFSDLSDQWWEKNGAFSPLHLMTPVRMEFILEALTQWQFHGIQGPKPLSNINLLDVGCGGGLLSEPLTRLGASVTGIDASDAAIKAAKRHSDLSGLKINYITGDITTLISENKLYDVVVASEVIEHVFSPVEFLKGLKKLVKPNGKIIITTISRSIKSLLIAKIAAEYITKMIPVGTHQWKKFIKPEELQDLLDVAGFKVDITRGISFKLKDDRFILNDNISMNYAIVATAIVKDNKEC